MVWKVVSYCVKISDETLSQVFMVAQKTDYTKTEYEYIQFGGADLNKISLV